MSGPSWCSTSFDLAAAPRSCSRSKVPTLGMSLSMTNLRSAMATSHKQRPHEFLNYEAFGLGAIRESLTRQGTPLRSSVIERRLGASMSSAAHSIADALLHCSEPPVSATSGHEHVQQWV